MLLDFSFAPFTRPLVTSAPKVRGEIPHSITVHLSKPRAPMLVMGAVARCIQEAGNSVRAGAESENHRIYLACCAAAFGSDKAGKLRRQGGSGGLTATPAINN